MWFADPWIHDGPHLHYSSVVMFPIGMWMIINILRGTGGPTLGQNTFTTGHRRP